jgi:hypothetical protein
MACRQNTFSRLPKRIRFVTALSSGVVGHCSHCSEQLFIGFWRFSVPDARARLGKLGHLRYSSAFNKSNFVFLRENAYEGVRMAAKIV